MYEIKSRNRRFIEVSAGFIMLLTTFTFIASIILDFDITGTYSTLNEDVSYLLDQYHSQKISSFAWIFTATMTLLCIPLFIMIFHKRLKIYHYLVSVILLAACAGFFLTGWLGLQLSDTIKMFITDNNSELAEGSLLQLLNDFREEQYYKLSASSCIGVFVILISLIRFKVRSFPIISSILFIISGPVLIFFNWYNTEHLLRTAAMTTIAGGIFIFCVKLIYSGLSPRK